MKELIESILKYLESNNISEYSLDVKCSYMGDRVIVDWVQSDVRCQRICFKGADDISKYLYEQYIDTETLLKIKYS
jgi:hypothetical protein